MQAARSSAARGPVTEMIRNRSSAADAAWDPCHPSTPSGARVHRSARSRAIRRANGPSGRSSSSPSIGAPGASAATAASRSPEISVAPAVPRRARRSPRPRPSRPPPASAWSSPVRSFQPLPARVERARPRHRCLPRLAQMEHAHLPPDHRAPALDHRQRDGAAQMGAPVAGGHETQRPARARPRHQMRAGGQRLALGLQPDQLAAVLAAGLRREERPTPEILVLRLSRGPPQPRSWGMVTPSVSLPTRMKPFSARRIITASSPIQRPPKSAFRAGLQRRVQCRRHAARAPTARYCVAGEADPRDAQRHVVPAASRPRPCAAGGRSISPPPAIRARAAGR
jgi:hypothetical protein